MATLKAVTKEIIGDLEKTQKLARFIGAALHAETFERIFNDGIGSDGASLGNYSIYTIAAKKDQGNFTSTKVNLRNTDTLANSWSWNASNNNLEIGFLSGSRSGDGGKSVTNTDLIPKLENQYGEIFALTSKENKLIDDLTNDFLNNIF